ncbi:MULTISPECIES: transglutaminase domain-containing protein [Flavobacterium]|uniref:transglutaminase-like domain-containing protein n=1 Tax=Flavobacterium TaxID=237 RepID=UPI00095A40FB|nr:MULTISPECIES: transglutaminase domain-containing protein [Flavobacterium]MBN9284977.1 transglutaminase domain-containing protein [Flavobacterium sp.]OJV72282.1 MAG: transglutaminase [Flavobacterium sp. 40-81]
MTSPTATNLKKVKEKLSLPKPWDNIVIFLLNILITIPIFIIAHQNLIDPEWFLHIDRVLLFVVILVLVQLALRLLKTVIIICIFLYLLALIWGTLFGGYGFNSVFEDYRAMIYTMSEDANPQDIIISKLLPFPNKSKIIDAVDYTNPKVRNFALKATTLHFQDVKGFREYRQIIQCFAVFAEVKKRWNYVNDPKGREYIASASESLQHFSGDCDDHAILMSALIRAIGGTPRVIHTGGHLYPEMLIGTKADLENVIYLIKEVLFKEESKGKDINYHIDERGQIWLNLDYTAKYPGGPFMSEEILGELTFN